MVQVEATIVDTQQGNMNDNVYNSISPPPSSIRELLLTFGYIDTITLKVETE